MAFITSANLKTRLASVLKVAEESVVSTWDQLLTDSVEWGYQEVLMALRKLGYTKAQADSWARGSEYNVSLGLFWTLTLGAGLHGYDDKFIAKFDRRTELTDSLLVLDSSGNIVYPANAEAMVGRGNLNTTPDMWVPDTDDLRRGEITKW